MGTLSNEYGYRFQVTLASANMQCLCILQQLYLGREDEQKINYEGSQTSKHRYLEQYTILVDFQAKELQSIYMS